MKHEMIMDRPIFVVSDLHAGDRGPRDNFAVACREAEFSRFLTFARSAMAKLVLAGDVLDFWQANLSAVIVRRRDLLDRLARLEAVYLLGNHDADLLQFAESHWINHSLLRAARTEMRLTVAGKRILILHGHQADPYCESDVPGVGRISAIATGLLEDKAGGPMLGKYRSVEDAAFGLAGRLKRRLFRWIGRPCTDYAAECNRRLLAMDAEVIVSGHTHRAGRIGDRHFNCGTWAEAVPSFVRLDPDGTAQVFDWVKGRPVPNTTELPN